MRILALDAALARCSATLVADQAVVAEAWQDGRFGHAATLPALARDVLARDVLARDAMAHDGAQAGALDAVAVVVGPGSFTGIRAAVALAHGLALGAGIPVVGVTVHEALAHALPRLGRRALWTVVDSRRGRVFLDQGAGPVATALDALPRPGTPVAIAGDAAIAVAARLAARGDDVMLTDARRPGGRHIAVVAEDRLAGRLPPLAPLPLYVDPPEARLPSGGVRPAPVA